jgi:hypothetical protein
MRAGTHLTLSGMGIRLERVPKAARLTGPGFATSGNSTITLESCTLLYPCSELAAWDSSTWEAWAFSPGVQVGAFAFRIGAFRAWGGGLGLACREPHLAVTARQH